MLRFLSSILGGEYIVIADFDDRKLDWYLRDYFNFRGHFVIKERRNGVDDQVGAETERPEHENQPKNLEKVGFILLNVNDTVNSATSRTFFNNDHFFIFQA
jgi:hypothetical protein